MLIFKNLMDACTDLTAFWSPKIVGEVNDQLIKVAKLKGQLVWHSHDDAEELFYVLKGNLTIEFEDSVSKLSAGDMLTVPRGVRHNPVAAEECWIVLIEPASTKHTGDVIMPQTKSLAQQY